MLEYTYPEIEFHFDVSQATNGAQIKMQWFQHVEENLDIDAVESWVVLSLWWMFLWYLKNFSFLDIWCLFWLFFPCTHSRSRTNNSPFSFPSAEKWRWITSVWTSIADNLGALIITLKFATFLYFSYCNILCIYAVWHTVSQFVFI